jgi:hypothetical protein
MIVRSTTTPHMPTTTAAATRLSQKFTPRCNNHHIVYAPSMKNSPWAMLMTFIIPKMMNRPIATSASSVTDDAALNTCFRSSPVLTSASGFTVRLAPSSVLKEKRVGE